MRIMQLQLSENVHYKCRTKVIILLLNFSSFSYGQSVNKVTLIVQFQVILTRLDYYLDIKGDGEYELKEAVSVACVNNSIGHIVKSSSEMVKAL